MRVADIRLYPIKALDPIMVKEARVLTTGALEFDRRWAMVDARRRFVNGKFHAGVHPVRASYDLARREVMIEGRAYSLDRQGPDIARWFSERLGEHVEWLENANGGFPDDVDSPGPTFVSTESLTEVAQWFDLPLDAARLRFRANVEIEAGEPFWEDRLYGSTLRVGDVEVFAVNPCQRCVVPSRDAMTGETTDHFQKRFAELRAQHMPVLAKTAQFNHYYRFAVNTTMDASQAGKTIRVGDPLFTVD